MSLRRIILGAATGLAYGYATIRTLEAISAARARAVASKPDARAYGKQRRALAAAGTVRSLVATYAFAYGPAGRRIDSATARLPLALRPIAFAFAVSILGAIADLGVDFVEDFAVERRYGLTEQTPKAWLTDYAKSALLSAGVTTVLAGLAAAAIRRLPNSWPVAVAAGALPLLIVANIVVPIYVMPLFNTFEPLEGPLEQRLRRLASRFGVGDAEILRMDMSRQTKKANAFVAGIGRTHRIVLGDTLVDEFEAAEVEFVVAHELGHYFTKDTWRLVGLSEATVVATLLFARLSVDTSAEADRNRPITMARLAAAIATAMQALRPAVLAFSREREWAADRFAIGATQDAAIGAAAFRRLRDQNLAEDDVPAWFEFFFSSHPSLGARIKALETVPATGAFPATTKDRFSA